MFLRFVGGQFEGGEFPLKSNREVTIGRGSEHDMVLDEDMVSRSHARILTFDGKVVVEDDGSTNGTLVNGERVERCVLKSGDQILIGQSLLEFVAEGKVKAPPANAAKAPTRAVADTIVANVRFLSGKVGGDSPSFVDLVCDIRKASATGTFVVKHAAEGTGSLRFENGQLVRVALALHSKDALELPSRKAFLRIMLWQTGRYKFEVSEGTRSSGSQFMNLDSLLEDSANELEVFNTFSEFLPNLESSLKMLVPLQPKLSDLSAEALDTLQLIMNHGQVRRVVDRGIASDFEIFQDILYLLQNGYVSET